MVIPSLSYRLNSVRFLNRVRCCCAAVASAVDQYSGLGQNFRATFDREEYNSCVSQRLFSQPRVSSDLFVLHYREYAHKATRGIARDSSRCFAKSWRRRRRRRLERNREIARRCGNRLVFSGGETVFRFADDAACQRRRESSRYRGNIRCLPPQNAIFLPQIGGFPRQICLARAGKAARVSREISSASGVRSLSEHCFGKVTCPRCHLELNTRISESCVFDEIVRN